MKTHNHKIQHMLRIAGFFTLWLTKLGNKGNYLWLQREGDIDSLIVLAVYE